LELSSACVTPQLYYTLLQISRYFGENRDTSGVALRDVTALAGEADLTMFPTLGRPAALASHLFRPNTEHSPVSLYDRATRLSVAQMTKGATSF